MSVSFLSPLAALVGVGRRARGVGAPDRRAAARRPSATALGLPAAGRRATVIDLVLLGARRRPRRARRRTARGRALGGDRAVARGPRCSSSWTSRDRCSLVARRASRPASTGRARSQSAAQRAPRHARRGRLADRPGAPAPLPDARGERVRRGGRPRRSGSSARRRDRRADARPRSSALGDLGRVAFFQPDTRHRVAVVLSDGETIPVDLKTLRDRLRDGRVATIFVQIWRGDEAVFDDRGTRDPAYRPDPTSQPVAAPGRRRARRAGVQRGRPALADRGSSRAHRHGTPRARRGVSSCRASSRRRRSLAAFVPLALLLYRRNV